MFTKFIALNRHFFNSFQLKKNPHALFGSLVLNLMWLQPIMGALRCHPDDRNRYRTTLYFP